MTLEEFKKLPPNEQADAYKELSDHDKYLARINEPLTVFRVHKSDCNPDEYERIHKRLLKNLEAGIITQEDYDDFENNQHAIINNVFFIYMPPQRGFSIALDMAYKLSVTRWQEI